MWYLSMIHYYLSSHISYPTSGFMLVPCFVLHPTTQRESGCRMTCSFSPARIFHKSMSRDCGEGRACPPCEQGEAGGPPGNRRELKLPRTPGRTVILFALAALRSVPQAGSQFRGRSRRLVKYPD
jgi:hypothetical protein